MGGSQGAQQMVAGGLDGARVPLLNRLRFSTSRTSERHRRAARFAAPKLSLKLNGLPKTVTPEVPSKLTGAGPPQRPVLSWSHKNAKPRHRTIACVDGFKISTTERFMTRRGSDWTPCRCSKRFRDHKRLSRRSRIGLRALRWTRAVTQCTEAWLSRSDTSARPLGTVWGVTTHALRSRRFASCRPGRLRYISRDGW